MTADDKRHPNSPDSDGPKTGAHESETAGGFTAPPVPNRPPSAANHPPSAALRDEPGAGVEGSQYESWSAPESGRYDTTSVPPGHWPGAPFEPQPQVRPRRKPSKAPLFLGIGIAVALIVGIILIVMVLTGTGDNVRPPTADSNGVVAEDVSPFDFEEGQCFTDFADATQAATVVTCETPHQAQLVNTFSYKDDAGFPGEAALTERADELCRDTQLSEEASGYEGRLRQQTAYPQPESWQEGDRRVDCFVRITSGDITGSLID